ncbi:cell division protein FtsB [Vibrio sp. FNV 38]|nr:cell division protein FtsB [Vibrio sp. FNV 38]
MRIFALMLLLVLGWLQYQLWFGKNGVSDLTTTKKELTAQLQVNKNLRERNNEMFAEIDDLRQGLDAIEERARHELGMVKEDETFYRIIGEDSQP